MIYDKRAIFAHLRCRTCRVFRNDILLIKGLKHGVDVALATEL